MPIYKVTYKVISHQQYEISAASKAEATRQVQERIVQDFDEFLLEATEVSIESEAENQYPGYTSLKDVYSNSQQSNQSQGYTPLRNWNFSLY